MAVAAHQISTRAVFFDAAGTLVAVAEPVGETYARLLHAVGLPGDARELEEAFRAAYSAAPPLAFPALAPTARAQAERQWWRSVVADAVGRVGIPHESKAFEGFFAAAFEHFSAARAWRAFPDAAPALRALRARGLRLAVVSNFDGRLHGILARLGLRPSLDAVILSSEVGAAKPSPAIFAAALGAVAADPGEVVHVGDDEDLDRRAALAAGLRALRIDRSRPPSQEAVRSLHEIEGRLTTA